MDLRKDVNEFLTTRRARISPEQAGLPVYGSNRRVAGLRREEVAMLAGVSVDYYTRIERGQLKGVSESVISSLARVLQLDDAERAYLSNLAALANPGLRAAAKPKSTTIRPMLLNLIAAMDDIPTYIRTERLDILEANDLAEALFAPVFESPAQHPNEPVNLARFCFLDPAAIDFFVDWQKVANDTVGVLRGAASRDPYDRKLTDLIGELCTRSEFFSARWADHGVFIHRMGTKRFNHPEVGRLELYFEFLDLPQDPGLGVVTYLAGKNTPEEQALKLLRIAQHENARQNESRTRMDAAFEN